MVILKYHDCCVLVIFRRECALKWTRKMPFAEPKGRQKCSKKITGIAAFVHTEITRKRSNVRCAMSEKVIQPLVLL